MRKSRKKSANANVNRPIYYCYRSYFICRNFHKIIFKLKVTDRSYNGRQMKTKTVKKKNQNYQRNEYEKAMVKKK